MNGVGPYAFSGVLDRRRLGEETHRPFGGMIGSRAGATHQPVDGGDVDDGASPSLTHLRDGMLGAQEHPLAIHVLDQVPLLYCKPIKGDRPAVGGTRTPNPSIVHQDMQRSEATHRRLDSVLPVLFSGHVKRDEKGLAPGLVDLSFDLLAFLFQQVPYDHLGSFPGQEPGFRSTHSPGAAAYQRNLTFESHGLCNLQYSL